MFEKIVVAVDGSEASQAAVKAAAGLAAKTGATVEVVHVHEHDFLAAKGPVTDLETPVEAKEIVEAALKELRADGLTAHGTLETAATRDVARVILAAADAADADLIVVGRRGLSTFSAMVLGSVSNKLIHLSKRPVMVAV